MACGTYKGSSAAWRRYLVFSTGNSYRVKDRAKALFSVCSNDELRATISGLHVVVGQAGG